MRVAGPRAQTDLPPLAEVLGSVPLFAGLDPEAVAELAGASEAFALDAGEWLFAQNDAGDGAYLVVSGELVASARTPGDGQRELACIGPGGVVGEFSLLDGGRRSAEVHAERASSGYRIDYRRFAALQAGRRPAAFAVLSRLRGEVARRIAATIAAMAVSASDARKGTSDPAGSEAAEASECARLLGLFPGFDRLSPGEWEAFAARARRVAVPRGGSLTWPGEACTSLFVVARGAVREMLGGSQLLVHGPGALAGSAAVVDGRAWPTGLEAREEAVVFAIAADEVVTPGPQSEGIAARLSEMMGPQLTRDLRRLSRVGNRALDPALETS